MMGNRVYVTAYFAQGEDAADDLDEIEEHGEKAFIEKLSGAINLAEGKETVAPPWGQNDTLRHEEKLSGGFLFLRACPRGLYLSLTFMRDSD